MNHLYDSINGYLNGTEKTYDPKFVLTYGEITYNGLQTLASIYQKTQPILSYPGGQRTFYDLGSGVGKNVIHMASIFPDLVSKGVELVQERHDKAMIVYNKLKSSHLKRRVTFTCGSLFDTDVSDAAWIFISNKCFSEEVNRELAQKLNKEVKMKTLVAFSDKLPEIEVGFKYISEFPIEMSWNNSSNVFLYQKI
jgi:SAM-dependent methyltransferase